MAGDMKTWVEAAHQGQEPLIVALRECVMDMVTLVNAMQNVTIKRPLTSQMVDTAIGNARELIVSLEALRTHAKT